MLQDFGTVMNYNPWTTEFRLQGRVIDEKPYFITFMDILICCKIALKNKRRNNHGLKPYKNINTHFTPTPANRLFLMKDQ